MGFRGLPTVVGLVGSLAVIGCCCLRRLFRRPVMIESVVDTLKAPAAELPEYFRLGLEENAEKGVETADASVEVPHG